MTLNEYRLVIEKLDKIAHAIDNAKRPGYSGNTGDDVLQAFKAGAKMIGITPFQYWAVHFHKHFSALLSYSAGLPQAENIDTRFADLINYIRLGFALYEEQSRMENFDTTSQQKGAS